MEALIPLNLPKATLTLTRKDNVIFVNCLIHKKKIIETIDTDKLYQIFND